MLRSLVNLGENLFTMQSAHGNWLYADLNGCVRCDTHIVDGWQVWEMEKTDKLDIKVRDN